MHWLIRYRAYVLVIYLTITMSLEQRPCVWQCSCSTCITCEAVCALRLGSLASLWESLACVAPSASADRRSEARAHAQQTSVYSLPFRCVITTSSSSRQHLVNCSVAGKTRHKRNGPSAAPCRDNAFFAPQRPKNTGRHDPPPSCWSTDVVKSLAPDQPRNSRVTANACSVVVPESLVTSQGFLEDTFRYHDVRGARQNNSCYEADSDGCVEVTNGAESGGRDKAKQVSVMEAACCERLIKSLCYLMREKCCKTDPAMPLQHLHVHILFLPNETC